MLPSVGRNNRELNALASHLHTWIHERPAVIQNADWLTDFSHRQRFPDAHNDQEESHDDRKPFKPEPRKTLLTSLCFRHAARCFHPNTLSNTMRLGSTLKYITVQQVNHQHPVNVVFSSSQLSLSTWSVKTDLIMAVKLNEKCMRWAARKWKTAQK